MNKKILLTGAGGFIGSHLLEALVAKGYSVRAFVHYNSFNRWGWIDFLDKGVKDNIEVITGDICDPHGVKSAAKGCDIIFHLAALIGIPYSYVSPQSYLETNIQGTLNILQTARESGVGKVLHTSTSEVYGTAQFVPITETHPINPQSPYAATKASADFLALSYFRSFNVPVTVVRPFNTFGPRQSARAVIPSIIVQVLSGRKKIKLGALSPRRDLTFVKDTAEGFIKAAESDKNLGEITNLGSNREISVGDLASTITGIIGKNIEIESDTNRIRPSKSEVERLLADNTKAEKLLRWKPNHTLEEGLKETIEFFISHSNLYKSEIYNV